MTTFTTSFRKNGTTTALLHRRGSYATIPGVYDLFRDGLPRWPVERSVEHKTVLRVTFRCYPAGDAPLPLLSALPAAACPSTSAP